MKFDFSSDFDGVLSKWFLMKNCDSSFEDNTGQNNHLSKSYDWVQHYTLSSTFLCPHLPKGHLFHLLCGSYHAWLTKHLSLTWDLDSILKTSYFTTTVKCSAVSNYWITCYKKRNQSQWCMKCRSKWPNLSGMLTDSPRSICTPTCMMVGHTISEEKSRTKNLTKVNDACSFMMHSQ